MIVYGSNSSHLLTEPVPGAACQACGTPDALRLSVLGRYAHVYWIPLFPFGKTGGLQCGHCQQVLPAAELPAQLHPHFAAAKARARVPKWHFAGLALLGLMVAGSFATDLAGRRHDAQLLAQPRVGDLYHVETDEPGFYTLLKVVEVNGNSLRLQQNAYQTNRQSEVAALDKRENYDAEPFDLTQYDLQIMQQQHKLVDVVRPAHE
ncbi:hypothetical protein D3Y59_01430 [Hymenobacter oligotrophus]|uniref:Zinc-ribbon domain-containing protein n=1 Tax=Hymenobacter oligotrophus TaxID=2319843 RepID=A0A3B7QX59_9BACT|nr:hypothetical protein [Hymenobacter oligotrophus]AYA35823.1 hypothetical protein D3Y59_01430 [Hymenobacter oligotrophus]